MLLILLLFHMLLLRSSKQSAYRKAAGETAQLVKPCAFVLSAL